ncbi:MAG TPA: hypothetical protein PKC22_16350, partial [Rhodocyclaceae bacterium]|nr:hypothetical protein [Rhodocyclaceae bacterium]
MTTDAQAALAQVREALAVGPTPGPWHHCQPFQSVRAERTIHRPVPAQRVDFVSTKTQPVHERIIIPMAGREAHVRSEDMAFIAACNPENIAALLAHVDAQAAEIERLRSERAELRDVLLRNGFVPCDIPACNCGSWHHRYGLPERMQEIKDALAEAGHELSNANGNLPINALKALVAERDDLRRQLDECSQMLARQAATIGDLTRPAEQS